MGTEFLGAGKSAGVDPEYGCEGAGVAGGGPEPMPQRGRDHWCGRFLSGKYGQRQTAGGTGFAGGKYSAGDAVAIHAVCAVVCGAGRIPGDISHCVGTVGERL